MLITWAFSLHVSFHVNSCLYYHVYFFLTLQPLAVVYIGGTFVTVCITELFRLRKKSPIFSTEDVWAEYSVQDQAVSTTCGAEMLWIWIGTSPDMGTFNSDVWPHPLIQCWPHAGGGGAQPLQLPSWVLQSGDGQAVSGWGESTQPLILVLIHMSNIIIVSM